MVFSVAIDDHELGITHVLNGKDHADNAKKETIIMNYLGWEAPHYQHWGRINFEGFKLSTTKTKFAISQGEYSGWDDIRLATLIALRRRGYQAQAFQKFALEIGLSLNDKTVSWNEFWKMINAFNRDLVEPTSNRYFFVDNPLEIEIEGVPGGNVELELHPDFPERGYRILKTGDKYLVSKVDFEKLIEGKVHRLIDAFNFRIEKGKIVFVSKSYEEYQDSNEKGMIIHWLPADDDNLEVQVLLEDHSTMKGFGEIGMKNLKVGDIVQLQRRFFARVDAIENGKIKFWYLHK